MCIPEISIKYCTKVIVQDKTIVQECILTLCIDTTLRCTIVDRMYNQTRYVFRETRLTRFSRLYIQPIYGQVCPPRPTHSLFPRRSSLFSDSQGLYAMPSDSAPCYLQWQTAVGSPVNRLANDQFLLL